MKKEQKEKKPETKKDQGPSKEELLELVQRTQANFENFRKQTEKRVEDMQGMATKHIIVEMLPVLDNFDLALKNTENHEEFVNGIKQIYDQMMKVLEDHHVKEMQAEGKFDPHKHEALMKVPSEKEEDEILEVFQKGFTLHDKVIRHAKVKLSAGKAQKSE